MKTIILGTEWDAPLREALLTVLAGMGATPRGGVSGFSGSQDLAIAEFVVEDERLIVESETYIGLSIIGPCAVVDQVAAEVRRLTS